MRTDTLAYVAFGILLLGMHSRRHRIRPYRMARDDTRIALDGRRGAHPCCSWSFSCTGTVALGPLTAVVTERSRRGEAAVGVMELAKTLSPMSTR